MVPRLFLVPSTLYASSGRMSSLISNPCVLAKFWSINNPPAPVSNKALVSTVLSFKFLVASVTGNEIDLLVVSATRTFEIYMDEGEDADVEAVFRFKNPT